MVSIQSDVYDQTSLGNKMPVSAVPTVLYVDDSGKVVEVEEARNMSKMNTLITQKSATPKANTMMMNLPEVNIAPASVPNMSMSAATVPLMSAATPFMPSTIMPQPMAKPTLNVELPKTEPSELNVVPALPISSMPATGGQVGGAYRKQKGGDAMAAFLIAAQQAAPAAVLLGAYSAYGRARRSSGLSAPVRSRKARALIRRLRARRTHRK
jgi:hypothetical protein